MSMVSFSQETGWLYVSEGTHSFRECQHLVYNEETKALYVEEH